MDGWIFLFGKGICFKCLLVCFFIDLSSKVRSNQLVLSVCRSPLGVQRGGGGHGLGRAVGGDDAWVGVCVGEWVCVGG